MKSATVDAEGQRRAARRQRRRRHGRRTAVGAVREPGRQQAAEVRLRSRDDVRRAAPSRAGRPSRGEKGYITMQGTAVRGLRSPAATSSWRATSRRSRARRSSSRAGSCSARSASTSASGSRTRATQGEAKVGDAKTIKIIGSADVEQVVADLEQDLRARREPARRGRPRAPAADARAEAARHRGDQGGQRHGLHGRGRPDPAPPDGQRRPQGHRVQGRRGAAAGHHVHQGRQDQQIEGPRERARRSPNCCRRSTPPASPISASVAAAAASVRRRSPRAPRTTWTSTPRCIEDAERRPREGAQVRLAPLGLLAVAPRPLGRAVS